MALINIVNPATKYKQVNLVWLFCLILFPVVLWVLPADFLDHTGFEICPSKLFFNFECLGCGMTRAVMHCHHFEWNVGFYYNYVVIVAYDALVIIWLVWVFKAIKRHQRFNSKRRELALGKKC
jgi:hypothetical protein